MKCFSIISGLLVWVTLSATYFVEGNTVLTVLVGVLPAVAMLFFNYGLNKWINSDREEIINIFGFLAMSLFSLPVGYVFGILVTSIYGDSITTASANTARFIVGLMLLSIGISGMYSNRFFKRKNEMYYKDLYEKYKAERDVDILRNKKYLQ